MLMGLLTEIASPNVQNCRGILHQTSQVLKFRKSEILAGHYARDLSTLCFFCGKGRKILALLASFAVPTGYESHVLSLGFVKGRGQFLLSNCSPSSCEENARLGEKI